MERPDVTNDDRAGLRGIELLSELDGETLRGLETQCGWHQFAANQTVLDRSDREKHDIYFVIEGTVRIVNYSPSGREIAFANVREGGHFGELAALTDEPRSAGVVAVTDCRLASVGPAVLKELLLNHPQLGLRLIVKLADIIRRSDQRIMNLSTLSAVQRVHVELLHLANRDVVSPGNWVVRPVPTQSEIASRAGTTRETVSRAMNQLAVAGIIERKGKSLYIRDRDRLAELAKSGTAQTVAAR